MEYPTRRSMVEAWKRSRDRPKNEVFHLLLSDVGDPDMAELMWIYWGERSLEILDDAMPALNPKSQWWKIFTKKNTVRSLLETNHGRDQIWRMLNDAGAWM